jgi:hypothetical protein
MTIEIIVIVAIAAFVVSGMLSKKPAAGNAKGGRGAPTSAAAAPEPQLKQQLSIEGTEQYRGDVSFVKQFGIAPRSVREIRFAKGFSAIVQAPDAVRDCLEMLRDEGNTRGPDVARLASGMQELQAGQAVYFVLVGDREMLAFQDAAR